LDADCTEMEPEVSIYSVGAEASPLPDDARFRFTLVDVPADGGSAFSHTLRELSPSKPYYARVAARNRLGFGLMRAASPSGGGSRPDGGVDVPFLKPDPPLSPYWRGGAPALELVSAMELRVTFGAGHLDGGVELTKFLVQWDTSPDFKSGPGGGPLGESSPDASLELCGACVTAFDLVAQHRRRAARRPQAAPRPSLHNLTVVSGHAVFDHFSGAFSLHLLGAAHTLRGLTPGVPYFARCLAQNRERGWGSPATTLPPAEVPRAAPPAPASLRGAVVDAATLGFGWPPAAVRGDRVRAYLLETFTAEPRASAARTVLDAREVQTVTTAGGPGGTFTLGFGAVELPLPGLHYVVNANALPAPRGPNPRRGRPRRVHGARLRAVQRDTPAPGRGAARALPLPHRRDRLKRAGQAEQGQSCQDVRTRMRACS
jgi:hypothetical protein